MAKILIFLWNDGCSDSRLDLRAYDFGRRVCGFGRLDFRLYRGDVCLDCRRAY